MKRTDPMLIVIPCGIVLALALASCSSLATVAEKLPKLTADARVAMLSIQSALEMLMQALTAILELVARFQASGLPGAVSAVGQAAETIQATLTGSPVGDAAIGGGGILGTLWLVVRNIASGKKKAALRDDVDALHGELEKVQRRINDQSLSAPEAR